MTFGNFWHADAGNIITLAGVLITLYMYHTANVKRITRLEFKVSLMWRRFAKRFNLAPNLDEHDHEDDDDNGLSHS